MKTLFGVVAIGFGLLLLAFGLLFLLGAGGELHRYVVAALGVGLGMTSMMAGAWTIVRARQSDPDRVRRELLALARSRDGQLTPDEIDAAFGDRTEVAGEILGKMVVAGDVLREAAGFVFPAFQPRLVERACPHCQYEAPLSTDATECPRCGAVLQTQRETQQASGDLYGMDE